MRMIDVSRIILWKSGGVAAGIGLVGSRSRRELPGLCFLLLHEGGRGKASFVAIDSSDVWSLPQLQRQMFCEAMRSGERVHALLLPHTLHHCNEQHTHIVEHFFPLRG
jgi:hypothetical protein